MILQKSLLGKFVLFFVLDLVISPPVCSALVKIGKFKTHEIVFTGFTSPANPFDTYLLRLEITDPKESKFIIDGFFDGDGNGGQEGKIWKARICPHITGLWSWRTIRGDAPDRGLQGLSGQFECVESGDRGGVMAYKQHFRFQQGDYVYLQGNFLDFTNGLPSTHTFMSEKITDLQRDAIMARQLDFHKANKTNIYFANKGDYGCQSVTPWIGSPSSNDKTKMDLARWKKYDGYIQRFIDNGIFAEMWFFADDSGFGKLSKADKNRLFRYAMARTSAFSNTLYVIALEWDEGWKESKVIGAGKYIQAHNPWRRLLSVHNLPVFKKKPPKCWYHVFSTPKRMPWAFSGQSWATFIAAQAGNSASIKNVNELAISLRNDENIPHLSEEFGILKANSNSRLRANMWANFCGGAAGGGTGSDLRAFMRFLEQSRAPFQRMHAANKLLNGGVLQKFCLAEDGHHYIVYSQSGAFTLKVKGRNLKGRWFNPRDPNASLDFAFSVSPGKRVFVPPNNTTKDWVLWISDGSNLRSGNLYPSRGTVTTTEIINRP